jgi:SpoIIAA-like
MIEFIGGFPENVIAIRAKDRVTRQDYESVLIPALNDALKRHGKIRLYYEFGPLCLSQIKSGCSDDATRPRSAGKECDQLPG